MQDEAEEQRDWVREAHLRLWHPETGELAALQLAPSFMDTLWAVGIVRPLKLGWGGTHIRGA